MFNVVLYGDKDFNNYELLEKKCAYYLQDKVKTDSVVLISGNSDGFDELVHKFAEKFGIDIEYYPLEWKLHGKKASYLQMEQMLKNANAVICFGCQSKACQEMISEAKKKKLIVKTVIY